MTGTAVRGKRTTIPTAPLETRAPGKITVGRRPLRVGDEFLQPGDEYTGTDKNVKAMLDLGLLRDDTEVTYVAARPGIKVGDRELEIGEEIPGAHTWPRLDSWVRSGRIARV